MVELTTVSETIGKFAEALIEKFKKGEKLSSEDYLFLTLYYLSREMEMIDKRIDKAKEEIKDYVDKGFENVNHRFEDTNKRIDDLKDYVNKGFESTNMRFEDTNRRIGDLRNDFDKKFEDMKSDIKEIRNDIRAINERIDKILGILTKK